MATGREYTAFIYATVTGEIMAEIPLVDEPKWDAEINGDGSWDITTPLGLSGLPLDSLRQFTEQWRYSVAVCWGDEVKQAGPIVGGPKVDDRDGKLSLTGPGLWGLFAKRILTSREWAPHLHYVTDARADWNPVDSLPNIAKTMIRNMTTMPNRKGSTLPLDIPANGPVGDHERHYPGYEMADVASRLRELTQVINGPDVLFQPYKVQNDFIRHRMVVGEPMIEQAQGPFVFDYGSTLVSLPVDVSGSDLTTTSFVKGTGQEREQAYARMASDGLVDAGWPMLDVVDSSHTTASEQPTLDAHARANLALNSTPITTFTATIRDGATEEPVIPGFRAKLNISRESPHPWLAPGMWETRILGVKGGSNPGELDLTLEERHDAW